MAHDCGHGDGREEEQKGAMFMMAKRCVDGGARVCCGGGEKRLKKNG